jgi:hypothetical protein
MASPRNFVVCLKSAARVSGSSNNYTLQLPALPRGSYKATFTIDTNQSSDTELAIQWPGVDNYYEAGNRDPFKTVCTFGTRASAGILYIQDPGTEVQVQFRQTGTAATAATIGETDVFVHFELMS